MEFATFLELMSEMQREGESAEELEAAFKAFDVSSTGFIEVTELRQTLMSKGEKMTEEEVDEFLTFADSKGKGEVNYRGLSFYII
jgi:calmodulin